MVFILISSLAIFIFQVIFRGWIWILIIPFGLQFLALDTPLRAFIKGGSSAGLVWLLAGSWYWQTTADIIAVRMAGMLHLGYPVIVIITTGLIAFIIAGFAALSGALLRGAISRPA
jgi:hypothetical protein